jgi:hypothetical protein
VVSFLLIWRNGESAAVPKGLPVSKEITYTIFANSKQLKKAGIDEKNIQAHKIIVQGEPTLDMPMDQCPGEIGIVCFQLSVIPEKNDEPNPVQEEKKEANEVVKQEIQQAIEQVAVALEVVERMPKGTEDMIPFESIIVPEEFLKFTPNQQKTQVVIDFVKKHGHLDEPIIIKKSTNNLVDGYRRYIVAQTLNLSMVPVVYK